MNQMLPSGPAARPRPLSSAPGVKVFGDDAGSRHPTDISGGEPQGSVRANRKTGGTPGREGEQTRQTPSLLMRPMAFAFVSVNQRLPSGPAAMRLG